MYENRGGVVQCVDSHWPIFCLDKTMVIKFLASCSSESCFLGNPKSRTSWKAKYSRRSVNYRKQWMPPFQSNTLEEEADNSGFIIFGPSWMSSQLWAKWAWTQRWPMLLLIVQVREWRKDEVKDKCRVLSSNWMCRHCPPSDPKTLSIRSGTIPFAYK